MGRVANQIASGDLSGRVAAGAGLNDEVGELVRNFNEMADRLVQYRKDRDLLHAGLEEKVRERTKELEEANRKLRKVESTVSHELRTPLTSIKAFTVLLLDAPQRDQPTRHRFLEIIDKESDRCVRLINDLLDLAKFDSGDAAWNIVEVDLRDVVAAALDPLASLAGEKGVRLAVRSPRPQIVLADADRIHQVVTNVAGNAIKFSPQGATVEVRVEQAATSGPANAISAQHALVAIADSGPGIPANEHERIFQRFHGGEKKRLPASGAGLGLAISKEIVTYHKGEIWVESEPGRGSTFYFTLPLKYQTRDAADDVAAHGEGGRNA
jgi:signal transduction histidine kinase